MARPCHRDRHGHATGLAIRGPDAPDDLCADIDYFWNLCPPMTYPIPWSLAAASTAKRKREVEDESIATFGGGFEESEVQCLFFVFFTS